jgi:hypothetical protein
VAFQGCQTFTPFRHRRRDKPRGFLSGALRKKMGVVRIHSAKRENGERTYQVATK